MRIRKLFLLLVMLFTMTGVAFAQQKVVKGTVVSSEDNEPIAGAYVTVKGKAGKGASTDVNGKFSITVSAEDTKLVVTYVGMAPAEVKIKDNLRVVLSPDAISLQDVVVVGYGSGKKISNVTASIVKVEAKQLENKPVGNPMEALQGKVAGLQMFTSSGEPSAMASMRIHGRGSFGATSSAPLYVLDGVVTPASVIQSMNPNDFESIQILKDASATAIYGSRSSNGVIFITTKRGLTSNKATIVASAMYSVTQVANESYFDRFMTTEELYKFYEETGLRKPEEIASLIKDYGRETTNWRKYFLRDNTPTYNADISVSGGSGKTTYYISGNVFDSDGMKMDSWYKKYSFRTNLNTVLNEYVRVSLKSTLSFDKSRTNTGGGASRFSGGLAWQNLPYYSPYDKDGNDYGEVKIPGYGTYSEAYNNSKYDEDDKMLSLHNVGNITITPIKGMTLNSTVSLQIRDNTSYFLRKPSHIGALRNGSISESFSRVVDWGFTNTAEYNFKVSNDNNFSVLLGHEYNKYSYRSMSLSGKGIEFDSLVLPGAATKDKTIGGSKSGSQLLSFFGRLSYDYAGKYFVDFTLRNDASSKFARDVRNGLFWSLGTMWKIKKENFLANVSWLDDARVKFSIGTTGNQSVADYAYLAQAGRGYKYRQGTSIVISASGNPLLTWESQSKTTLGLHASVFNRVSVDLEFYNRVVSELLNDVPSPGTSGFGTLPKNVGKYQNRGVDLRIDGTILRNRQGDNLTAYLSFNYNKDKIIELFSGLDKYEFPNTGVVYKVGEPITFYAPIFKHINPTTGYAEWYLPGDDYTIKTMDDSRITNVFSDEKLNQNTNISRYAPINGGFGFSGQYKGFYLQADFVYTLGKYTQSGDMYFYLNPMHMGNLNPSREVFDYWKKEGDIARFPSLASGQRFMEYDTRGLVNSSFMRLKNLTVGYSVPAKFLSKQKVLEGAKVFFTGRNLLTFTSFPGLDPENERNVSTGGYPNTKQFSFGVELKF